MAEPPGAATPAALQRENAELRLRLAEAEDAVRRASERQDVFLATLAHELRNPLAPIRNSVQVLRLTQDAQLQQRALATMENQLKHLVRLVDDLLDVDRITRAQIVLRRERLDIAMALQQAVEGVRPFIDSRSHALEMRLPTQALYVDGDITRLTQVVGNVLDNACRYTPDGGHIVLAAQAEPDAVCVTVQDNGAGIAVALLPRLFDFFTPAQAGHGRSGLGVGLALVKRLVDLHGGRVHVHSEGEGCGCRVELRLPPAPPSPTFATAADEAAAPLAPPQQQAVTPRRVMVAEDNADSADSIAMMLQLMGHEVRIASDGQQAVALAASFRPHVVLMDIGMPGVDGYEAARRIRAEPWGRQILLVALTGWNQESDRQRSLAAGLDQHLVKPVDPELLSTLLEAPARH